MIIGYYTFLDLIKDEYQSYRKKRLLNVMKTVMTSSILECARLCSATEGCLAVNAIGSHDVTCEMARGLTSETEMQDDSTSDVIVLSKLNVPFPVATKIHVN